MASQSETSKILSAISELKAQISSLEAKMGALALSPEPLKPAKGKAAKKPRDPDAPKRQPTEWILFTNRVRSLLKANDYPVGSEVQQFCSYLKSEMELYKWTDDNILTFRQSWTAPERKVKEPKSEEPKPEKPKKVLSPEHKAALLEGKKKKAAERKASESESDSEKPKAKAAAEVPLPASEPQSEAESTGSSESKKRGPKKGTKLTEEQKAARKAKRAENKAKKLQTAIAPSEEKEEGEVSESEAEAEPEPEVSLNPLILKGKRYLWNPLNNHCYHREEDGTQGDWAGLLDVKTKTIKMVPEPEDE